MIKFVTKADGSKERFDRNKIIQNCLRAGADRKAADDIARFVEGNLEDGASTHIVYQTVQDELEKRSEKMASVFGLREAIADLDSESFEFYAMKVLEAQGYKCKWNTIVEGGCVEHQIDVIAKGKNGTFYVECKRHFNPHRFCGLEVPLEVHARFEDLKDGFASRKNGYDFSGAWIFTNSKFSLHAKKYAKAKSISLTGWGYGLQEIVESKKIYPKKKREIGRAHV